MAESILNTIEKITGEKILRTEEEEPLKPKRESGLKKYWRDVKSGKIVRVKPWSKRKAKKLEEQKLPETLKKEESKPEIKKEEPKVEVKLEKSALDKEAEEIKKELEKNVTDGKILKKSEPLIEIKKPEIPEIKGSDSNFWLYVIGAIGLIMVGLKFLSGRGSSQVPTGEQPTQPKKSGYQEFDIGRGRIINIPVK